MIRFITIVAVLLCVCFGSFWVPTLAQTPVPKQGAEVLGEDQAASDKDILKRIAELRAKLAKIEEEIGSLEGRKEEAKDEEPGPAKKPEPKVDAEQRLRLAKALEGERRDTLAALMAALKQAPDPAFENDNLAILRMLQQPIDTRGFQDELKLTTALERLSDMWEGKLPILVNRMAFLKESPIPQAPDPKSQVVPPDIQIYDIERMTVSLRPPVPKRISMETALNMMLALLDDGEMQATFRIRQGHVEIIPVSYLAAKRVLREPVSARTQDRPLEKVLRDFSDQTGLTINLDPAVGKKAATTINASFRNVALEDALVTVTEMAELKFVVLRESVYVTLPGKVEAIEAEEKIRREKRETAKRASATPP